VGWLSLSRSLIITLTWSEWQMLQQIDGCLGTQQAQHGGGLAKRTLFQKDDLNLRGKTYECP
jgi:hypothetical protein